jgi:hypothetical protein
METSTAVTTKSHSARSVRRVFQKSRWNSIGAAVKPGRRIVQRAPPAGREAGAAMAPPPARPAR